MNRTPASAHSGRPEGQTRSAANPAIRVLVADDHAVLRQALRYMLESQPGLEVVGEASNGREAVASALARHDVLLGPATVSVAPRISELADLTLTSTRINHLNIPWSGAGTPVIVMPAGTHSSGLPMSVQVVADRDREDTLFRVARALEASVGGFPRPSISHEAERWDRRHPSLA